ncbi:TPA: hypothetical protein N0F65_010550 [Lagenidium giganteum]|uniref:Uncharacterized protein n=1 Tax=Lagenidium giganteum TaxID=4803 RepID=A0AAV2ZA26_9STRA|nr:TPA: hypothetical protein N0F65_010550 [Lagenidium giganteum]
MEALMGFARAYMHEHDDVGADNSISCAMNALRLSVSPPPAVEEYSHELAMDFMYHDEMQRVRQLQQRIEQGKALLCDVYCARSCARALPTHTAEDDPAQALRFHLTVLKVLQPRINKMKDLSEYCTQTVVIISDNIQRITVQEPSTRLVPDVLLDALVQCIDVLLQLSQLHDEKSSFRNDFSVFKRTFQFVREHVADSVNIQRDIQILQEFFQQTKGSILDSLRHNLTSVKRASEYQSSLCADELFRYCRVLPCLLAILDKQLSSNNGSNLSAQDKRQLDLSLKLLSSLPIVPGFMEMPVKTSVTLSMDTSAPPKDKSGLEMLPVTAAREIGAFAAGSVVEYHELLPRYVIKLQVICDSMALEEASQVYAIVNESLCLLAKWKRGLLLYLATKYEVPADEPEGKSEDTPRPVSPYIAYERAVKTNFSPKDTAAINTIIHTVKSLVQLIRRDSAKLVPVIRRHVYTITQKFCLHTLLPILHRSDKHNLSSTRALLEMRTMGGDWRDGQQATEDFKKRRKDRTFPTLNDCTTPPTLSQLVVIRTLANSIFERRSMSAAQSRSGGGLFFARKDLDSKDFHAIEDFFAKSSPFSDILDLDGTLDKLSDFSGLWYRELYLDIARTPQFPIDLSFPWILLEQALSTASKVGVEICLSVLDVYNDAYRASLYQFRQRHLCDEVEAEAALCLEQFMFHLTDQVYDHFKNIAAESLIHPDFRQLADQLKPKGGPVETPPIKYNAFDVVLTEQMATLVNMDVTFRGQLTASLQRKVIRDLETSFSKMESSDIGSIVQTRSLVQLIRRTHTLLAQSIPLAPFDLLLLDADCGSSAIANAARSSRLFRHLATGVCDSLSVHFAFDIFTRSFRQAPLPYVLWNDLQQHKKTLHLSRSVELPDVEAVKRVNDGIGFGSQHRMAFDLLHRSNRGRVSFAHLEAMTELLSEQQVELLVQSTTRHVLHKVDDMLRLSVPSLASAIPPYKFPRFMYRVEGCFGFFESKFKHLLDSEELAAHVFHFLREIGNSLLFVLVLSDLMVAKDAQSHPGQVRESLFSWSLSQVRQMLNDSGLAHEWRAVTADSPSSLSNPSSFFFVWTALEFISCVPQVTDGASSVRELYGDGVQFAGCVLVHLLEQHSQHRLWNVCQHMVDVDTHEQVRAHSVEPVQRKSLARRLSGSQSKMTRSSALAQSIGTVDPVMAERAKGFVRNARVLQQISGHMFAILNASSPIPRRERVSIIDPKAMAFSPPVFVPPAPLVEQPLRSEPSESDAAE